MSTFYNTFIKLCNSRNIAPTNAAQAVGLSNAALTGWKNGKLPRDATLQKIADYFGVSTNYLLTGTDKEGYYLNEETMQIAQEVFERPEMRVLFDAARDASPEDIKVSCSVLLALKKKERGKND